MKIDPSSTYVALLRGINVGGKNRLPMRDLADMFTLAGSEAVQTYIQSGNIVFMASAALAGRIPTLISNEIKERFGYRVPVVLRSVEEMRNVVDSNPFRNADVDAEKLHVVFLADLPQSDKVAQMDPHRSPTDAFVVRGREVFLHCPKGLGRTKLTNAYFDSNLGTVSTVRNWRTVVTLLKMAIS